MGLLFAVSSGLSLGKEGPFIHIGAAIGENVSRLFGRFRENEARRREILSASAACGLSVAFTAPIGGVLYSLEEVSYYFPHRVLWLTFICAAIGAVILEKANPEGLGTLTIQARASWLSRTRGRSTTLR